MMPMMLRQPSPVRRNMRFPRGVDGGNGSVSVFDVVVFMFALLIPLKILLDMSAARLFLEAISKL